MTKYNEGLPGIYRGESKQRAIANASLVAKRNSREIAELKERVAKLEKDVEAPKSVARMPRE